MRILQNDVLKDFKISVKTAPLTGNELTLEYSKVRSRQLSTKPSPSLLSSNEIKVHI